MQVISEVGEMWLRRAARRSSWNTLSRVEQEVLAWLHLTPRVSVAATVGASVSLRVSTTAQRLRNGIPKVFDRITHLLTWSLDRDG